MLLNLKALNEGFENKYKLEEAFDDSMPKWLKDRLAYSAVQSGDSKVHSNKFKPYGYENGADNKYSGQPRASFQQNRSTGESGWGLSLASQFLKAGVDLSKVKVVEAPIPNKIPRITKNNQIIPVFLLDNGQVWAKGINDREEYSGYPYESFKSMKADDILSKCKAYCYIDLSDPNINTVGEKRFNRQKLKAELNHIPNYFRTESNYWDRVDKSGYTNKYNVKRYQEKARELKLKNVDSMIETCAQKIVDYKTQLSDILSEVDITEIDNLANIQRAVDDLRDACRYYQKACEYIDIMNSEQDARLKTSWAENVYSQLEYSERELIRVDERVGHLMKVSADW